MEDKDKFKKIRENMQKTQNQMAADLRLCVRTIRNYESGKTEIPFWIWVVLNDTSR